MNEKHEKVCGVLNYFEHFLTFLSAVSGCSSISAFASLLCVPVGIASSAVGLKICTLTAGFRKYQSIIKKIRKSTKSMLLARKSAFLAKTKLITIKVLISKALIKSYIDLDEFISVNNVRREYNKIKKNQKS